MNLAAVLSFLKQSDKQGHIMAFYGITMTLGYLLIPFLGLLYAVYVSATVALVLGFSKERFYDWYRPLIHTADWLDFLADVIGVASASMVLLAPMIFTLLKAQA